MKRMPIAGLLAVVIAFAACKKEKSQEEPSKEKMCDYAPYTTGSVFDYEMVNVSPADTFRYSLTAMGDSTIGDSTYRIVSDASTGDYSLFNCGGGSYTQLVDASVLTGGPSSILKTVYLKENVGLGQSWDEMVPITLPVIGDVDVVLTYTIIQKGTAKTVLGTSYKNVLGVRMEISLPPLIPAETIATNYYAKGVGLIQADREEDTTRITGYVIK